MSKNKDRGLSDLIPIALFIVGWIILGQIDKHNPGSGKSILVAIFSVVAIVIGFKFLKFIINNSKKDLVEYAAIIGKGFLLLVLLVIIAGLFDCGGSGLNLNGVRGL